MSRDEEYYERDNKRIYHQAIEDLQNRSPRIRQSAFSSLKVLGYRGYRDAIAILGRELLNEQSEDLRIEIISCLAYTGRPEALSVLRPAAFDISWRVRTALATGIYECVVQFIMPRFGTDYPSRNQEIAMHEQAISLFSSMNQDPHPDIRDYVQWRIMEFTEWLSNEANR